MYKERIETKNLILKKAAFEDWFNLYRNVWSHEETAKHMLWTVTSSEDEAKERMKRTIEYQKEHFAYTVYEKESNRAIGFAGMVEIENGVYEDTGVALGPDYIGRGYGKQLLNALIEYIFTELQAKKIICSNRSQNIPSRSLQLSCGFKYVRSEDRIDKRNGQAYTIEFNELANPKYSSDVN